MAIGYDNINNVSCASRINEKNVLYHMFLVLLIFLQVTLTSSINNDSILIEFEPHSVLLTVKEHFNVTYTVTESCIVKNITLYFCNEGETDILGPKPFNSKFIEIQNYSQSFNLMIQPAYEGHTILYANAKSNPANMTETNNAFVRIAIHYSQDLDYLSNIVGWTYFVAWSISFYPQTYLNWKRKSVIGLHFDFLALNVIGFILYSIFNIGLYWIPAIEQEYLKRHQFGVNPVQLNDVIFSIHAVFACLIQVIQCIIYERGDQKISKTANSIIGGLTIISILALILSGVNTINWLDFLYILSYIKLFITLIKYIPQAYYNFLRKSTSGWSIGNVMLDFSGGAFSIFQMFIIACNYNDWSSIFGDPTKFGLGLFSMIFDILFIVQHYVLYRHHTSYEALPEHDQSTLSASMRSNEESSEPIITGTNGFKYGSTRVIVY